MNAKGWSRRFFDPIILPDGRKLLTLRDAATYIIGLPKAEHEAEEWQNAMETLLLVTLPRFRRCAQSLVDCVYSIENRTVF
jgi:hypothetical protein